MIRAHYKVVYDVYLTSEEGAKVAQVIEKLFGSIAEETLKTFRNIAGVSIENIALENVECTALSSTDRPQ